MDDQQVKDLFSPLLLSMDDDIGKITSASLFAHYTSIETLEKIMRHEEIWFSNPLFMNDLEELRFGMNQGFRLFEESQELTEACGTKERADRLRNSFYEYYMEFDNNQSIDVYVFCMSEHDSADDDGLLSMWRAYGSNGNGAALVFNGSFVSQDHPMPIVIAQVRYGTAEQRSAWTKAIISDICQMIRNSNIQDNQLHIPAYYFFSLLKMISLTTKHYGFREEREWRLIYTSDYDEEGILADRIKYAVGSRGIEPKFKLKIEPLPVEPVADWTFETILDRIVLGPSVATPLARRSIERMLDILGKGKFRPKVRASTIPLRPS